jgi:hypothetical protein
MGQRARFAKGPRLVSPAENAPVVPTVTASCGCDLPQTVLRAVGTHLKVESRTFRGPAFVIPALSSLGFPYRVLPASVGSKRPFESAAERPWGGMTSRYLATDVEIAEKHHQLCPKMKWDDSSLEYCTAIRNRSRSSLTSLSYAGNWSWATVPEAPPTSRNQRATSCHRAEFRQKSRRVDGFYPFESDYHSPCA